MIMAMSMSAALRIGALLRRERRVQDGDRGAEPPEHRYDHVIVANAQTVRQDLHGQMPIAEMPGQTRKRRRRLRRHVAHLLVRRRDLDDVAGLEDETIARTENARLRQIEQKGDPVIGRQCDAAAMPVIEVEGGKADPTLRRPGAAGNRFDGPAHGQNRK
jgi:hypothetical protein